MQSWLPELVSFPLHSYEPPDEEASLDVECVCMFLSCCSVMLTILLMICKSKTHAEQNQRRYNLLAVITSHDVVHTKWPHQEVLSREKSCFQRHFGKVLLCMIISPFLHSNLCWWHFAGKHDVHVMLLWNHWWKKEKSEALNELKGRTQSFSEREKIFLMYSFPSSSINLGDGRFETGISKSRQTVNEEM